MSYLLSTCSLLNFKTPYLIAHYNALARIRTSLLTPRMLCMLKRKDVCEVSSESYILFFTVNVMLTATVNLIAMNMMSTSNFKYD